MFACGIPVFFQEVAAGQYLGTGGCTFVGQLVPIFQVQYEFDHLKKGNIELFPGCWIRHNDDRVLAWHLLLHHHRLDAVLSDRHPVQCARAALETLRSVSISFLLRRKYYLRVMTDVYGIFNIVSIGNWWNSPNCNDGITPTNTSVLDQHDLVENAKNATKTPVEEYWE